MPLGTTSVGSNQLLDLILADPNNATNLASVLALGDATNLTGLYAALSQKVDLLLNTGGTYDRARSAPGTTGIPSTNSEGTKRTYSVGTGGFTPAATATDFFTIVGSATTTVRVTRISIWGFATSAITEEILLIIRTTADLTGTASQPTIAQHDQNDAAATAVANLYSVNPGTLGSSGGVLRQSKLNCGATGAAGQIVWDFGLRNAKAIVLRGVAQCLALNYNGAAVPSGMKLSIEVEFTEE
jgi:hypothetical protein